jgi:hypothetical protein
VKDVGIFYGNLVNFMVILVYFVLILVYFSRFGMLYQEKSGNPVRVIKSRWGLPVALT